MDIVRLMGVQSRLVAKAAAIALSAAVLLAVGAESRSSVLSVLDSAIRSFDFGNALWHDYTEVALSRRSGTNAVPIDDQVLLVNGRNEQGRLGPYSINAATFADADGDGDEDALVGLNIENNAASTTYYLWRWQGGRAEQIRFPAYYSLRCGPQARQISPHRDGFEIRANVRLPDEPCAADPTVPLRLIVGLRDGYPTQLSPLYGYADHCVREGMLSTLAARQLQVRVAPEDAAPVLTDIRPGDRILVSFSEFDDTPAWRQVILPGGRQEICGVVFAGRESFGRMQPLPQHSTGPRTT